MCEAEEPQDGVRMYVFCWYMTPGWCVRQDNE